MNGLFNKKEEQQVVDISSNKKIRTDIENLNTIIGNLTINIRNQEAGILDLKNNFQNYQTQIKEQIKAQETILIIKASDAAVQMSKVTFNDMILDIENRIDEYSKNVESLITQFEAFRNENRSIIQGYDEMMNNLKNININLDGSLIVDKNEKSKNCNIKEFVKKMSTIIKGINDNVERVAKRQDTMLNIVSSKLKNDLKEENASVTRLFKDEIKRVVEKFGTELENKAEVKLIEKFATEIEEKFDYEVSKKLDKTEIKKNTNLLNRKIDFLETRLAKTFVDTLIELKFTEAPIIAKNNLFNSNKENKCVVCGVNQDWKDILKNEIEKENGKKSVKDIQIAANKLGFGSYSKFVANCDHNSVLSEINVHNIKNNTKKNNDFFSPIHNLPTNASVHITSTHSQVLPTLNISNKLKNKIKNNMYVSDTEQASTYNDFSANYTIISKKKKAKEI